MKKLLFTLIVALTALAHASAYTFEVDGIYYNKNGTNATVTFRDNTYNSYSGEVLIPDTVTYDGVAYPVTAIGDNAFQGCDSLTAVTIPAAVMTIGSGAFNGCTALEGVVIPQGVPSIPSRCFYGCSSLKSIIIPSSVTSISTNGSYSGTYSAFYGCTSVTALEWNALNCPQNGDMPAANIERVTIGEGVTVLPDNFLYQSKITEIDIPESVTTIRYRALRECAGLTELHLPSGLTTLGNEALTQCVGLKSLVIPSGVTVIGENLLYGCTGLEHVTLPPTATSLGSGAFNGCTSLEEIVIPEGVTTIPSRCFYGCSSLKSIVIPSSVTSISTNGSYSGTYSAFYGCTSVTDLEWNALNCPNNGDMPAANIERVTIGEGVTVLPDNFLYQSKITEIDIPESVTTIRYRALRECAGLTELHLPSGLTTLGNESLTQCTGLTSLVIPSGVTQISENLLYGCTGLVSVTLPPAATSLGSGAFNGCTALEGVVIPQGVPSIPSRCFYGCSSLKSIIIPSSVTSIRTDGSYSGTYSAFYGCTSVTDLEWNALNCPNNGDMPAANIERVTIGEGVTVLPNNFLQNSKITEVAIPASVKTIGSYAFNWCTELKEIYIPDSVTVINEHTFGACLGLRSAHLPTALTEIKRSGFERCPSLKEMVIPAGVTKLGDYVFYNCDSLTSLTVRAIEPPTVTSSTTLSTLYNIAKLRVPRGVIEDYKAANYWKNFLTIVGDEYDFEVDGIYYVKSGDNTASVTYKDTDYNTYSGAVSIPKQVDYEGVTYRVTGVSFEAFKDCPDLTKVTMSKRIKSIGYNAFENCTSLTKVTIPDNVTAIGANAFNGCTALTEAVIGSSIATIGTQAFDGCDNLNTVMSRSVTPPTLAGMSCFNCYETATLKVPVAAVEDYSSADYWKEFMEIIGVEINAGPGDVDGDGHISIADVTMMIDSLLGGADASFYEENADFDEDGGFSIADVTALIDYLLTGDDD